MSGPIISRDENIVLSYTTGSGSFAWMGRSSKRINGCYCIFQSKKHKEYNSAFMEMNNILSSNNEYHYSAFQALRFFRNDKDFHFKGVFM